MSDERTLVLLRHAKSDWSGEQPDLYRPLADRGSRQASDAGRWLAANLDGLGLAVVSPATRAQSTWELVAAELDDPPPARTDDRVYDASADELLTVVRDLPADVETAVLVGHNPGFEALVVLLTGEPTRLTTSALALIAVPGAWSDVTPRAAALRTAGRPPA